MTEKRSRNVHVLTSREKNGNIRAKACCNVAGQFLPPVLIFKGVNKKQEFGDGRLLGFDMCTNRKSSNISTD
jgi:hypothetical protein